MKCLTPEQWIVLDNLKHGWHYTTNLARPAADKALEECEGMMWVVGHALTPSGQVALISAPVLRKYRGCSDTH